MHASGGIGGGVGWHAEVERESDQADELRIPMIVMSIGNCMCRDDVLRY